MTTAQGQQGRAQFGVAGMGVMGQSLALNVADHGYRVAVWDRHPERFDELRQKGAPESLKGHARLEDFVAALERPRRILLMVTAGAAVDSMMATPSCMERVQRSHSARMKMSPAASWSPSRSPN